MEQRIALQVATHGHLSLVGVPGVRFTKRSMRSVLLAIVLHGLTGARQKSFQRQADNLVNREYDATVIERGIADLRRLLTECTEGLTLPLESWLYIEKTISTNLQARRIGLAQPLDIRGKPPPAANGDVADTSNSAGVSAPPSPRPAVVADLGHRHRLEHRRHTKRPPRTLNLAETVAWFKHALRQAQKSVVLEEAGEST